MDKPTTKVYVELLEQTTIVFNAWMDLARLLEGHEQIEVMHWLGVISEHLKTLTTAIADYEGIE